MPNNEQMKSALRSVIIGLFMFAFGWLARKGYVTSEQVTAIMGSEAFAVLVPAVAAAVWGWIIHNDTNAVATVNAMAQDPQSPVRGTILEDNTAGREMSTAIPGNTTVVAGTTEARAIAQTNGVK